VPAQDLGADAPFWENTFSHGGAGIAEGGGRKTGTAFFVLSRGHGVLASIQFV
jgi:hypothetical protein